MLTDPWGLNAGDGDDPKTTQSTIGNGGNGSNQPGGDDPGAGSTTTVDDGIVAGHPVSHTPSSPKGSEATQTKPGTKPVANSPIQALKNLGVQVGNFLVGVGNGLVKALVYTAPFFSWNRYDRITASIRLNNDIREGAEFIGEHVTGNWNGPKHKEYYEGMQAAADHYQTLSDAEKAEYAGEFFSMDVLSWVPVGGAVVKGASTIIRRGTGVRRVTIPGPVVGFVDDAAPAPRIPHGFPNARAFKEFGNALNRGLKSAGYDDVQPIFQGSSVTGKSFTAGAPFDAGRLSDFDIALASPSLLDKAKALGIELRSKGTRTGPLKDDQLKALGLFDVASQMRSRAGRQVDFMIYGTVEAATNRSPSILVPR